MGPVDSSREIAAIRPDTGLISVSTGAGYVVLSLPSILNFLVLFSISSSFIWFSQIGSLVIIKYIPTLDQSFVSKFVSIDIPASRGWREMRSNKLLETTESQS